METPYTGLIISRHIEELAKEYAIKCHSETNHFYDGDKPYSYHLKMVVDTAKAFQELIPESDRLIVFSGCWVHDVGEDCRQTRNDVKYATNETVAELCYALTNEKGRNRAERANEKYYKGIRQTKYATFIKLCDRIANVTYSLEKKDTDKSMLEKYRKENPKFIDELIKPDKYKLYYFFLKLFLGERTYRLSRINRNPYGGMMGILEAILK